MENFATRLTEIGKPALSSFVKTLLGMLVLGVVLAGAGFAVARGGSRGALAALAALALTVVLGWTLALKRGVGSAMLAGVTRFDLAGHTVRALFDQLGRLLPGGLTATAQRLPLAQAEEKLRAAVQASLRAPADGGGLGGSLRRAAERRLVLLIEQATLAKFRTAGADGVDLVQVRDELTSQAQGLLQERVAGALLPATLLLLLASVGGSLAVAWLLRPAG